MLVFASFLTLDACLIPREIPGRRINFLLSGCSIPKDQQQCDCPQDHWCKEKPAQIKVCDKHVRLERERLPKTDRADPNRRRRQDEPKPKAFCRLAAATPQRQTACE